MTDCLVKQYCSTVEKKKGVCRTCKEYNKFNKKNSKSAVAIGRSNKRKGKKSEKKLLLHFQRQNLEARIIEGSGCLKKIKADADADLRVVINGKERKVENKKRTSFERIRKLINSDKILYITGFCYVMNENIFYDIISSFNGKVEPLLNGNIVSTDRNNYPIREVSDRNYGELHKFFLQDNADIVSLDESYKDFMFALKPSLFKEVVE
jgi:hypothetical protein